MSNIVYLISPVPCFESGNDVHMNFSSLPRFNGSGLAHLKLEAGWLHPFFFFTEFRSAVAAAMAKRYLSVDHINIKSLCLATFFKHSNTA